MSDLIYPAQILMHDHRTSSDPDNAQNISISEARFKSAIIIKAWPDSMVKAAEILCSYLGYDNPPKIGSFSQIEDGYCVCLTAGHYIIFSNNEELYKETSALYDINIAAVTDVSHSRDGLRLEGRYSTALLNKGLAICLDDNGFPIGSAAMGTIHSIGVLLLKLDNDHYLTFTYTSFCHSFFEWLIDCAKEYGYVLSEYQ